MTSPPTTIGPELVIFGSLTIDNVIRADGEVLPQSFGGNCIYAALGARLWSDRVGMVSRCGQTYAEAPLALMRDLGVDTAGVRRLEGPHRRNTAFAYRPDGGRTRTLPEAVLASLSEADRARFVDSATLPDAHETHRQFAPDLVDLPEAWRASLRGAHYATAPLVKLLDVVQGLRAFADRRPVFLADSLWLDRPEPGPWIGQAILELADAVMPSEQDLENRQPGQDHAKAVAELLQAGASAVVLKRGDKGCRLHRKARPAMDVPALPVTAVDPTGAGDSFCGGVLAGLVHTGDLVQACHYGVVSASFCVEQPGLQGLIAADRREAARRIETLSARTGVRLDPLPTGLSA